MREMKDSGIEWIGEIPKHWKCCKQKYGLTLLNGRAFKESEFLEDGKYKVLRVGNLFTNPIWHYSNLMLEDNKYCQKGDLLYSWSMSYAPFIWSGDKVIYHYHIWKVLIDDILCKKFVYYYLLALTEALYAEIHETTMGFITMGIMNNSYLPYCNLEEQQQIANFLDTQCSKIDATAEDIQKEISLLEDYKKSVITEAVTKGLNPDAEMKDSRIEWVGKVPKIWSLKPIRALFDEVTEKNFLGTCSNALKFTYGSIVRKPNFDADADNYVASTILNYTVVEPGTIMLNGLNLNFDFVSQRIGLVKEKGVITSAYMAFKPNEKQLIDSEFATYLFKAYDGCKAFHNMGGGVRKILNFNEFKKYYIPLPDLNEQQHIVDLLDTKCSEIDSLIADKKRQFDILADYKKSLIYEYVTGKKEVPVNE